VSWLPWIVVGGAVTWIFFGGKKSPTNKTILLTAGVHAYESAVVGSELRTALPELGPSYHYSVDRKFTKGVVDNESSDIAAHPEAVASADEGYVTDAQGNDTPAVILRALRPGVALLVVDIYQGIESNVPIGSMQVTWTIAAS
jgi:hypothetical protein